MESIHTVRLSCPTCRQEGSARWAHPEAGHAGPRKLTGLTAGFCSVERGDGREAEILCTRCNDPGNACHDERRLLVSAS